MKLEQLIYDKNSQDVKLLPGMPVIARINSKALGFVNNQSFTIKKIDQVTKFVTLKDTSDLLIEIKIGQLQQLVYVVFCITVHKSQGGTYNTEYTIHEFERFDERLKYVALSRGAYVNLINIL